MAWEKMEVVRGRGFTGLTAYIICTKKQTVLILNRVAAESLGYTKVDVYIDTQNSLIGIKPNPSGSVKICKVTSGRGQISITALGRKYPALFLKSKRLLNVRFEDEMLLGEL